MDKEENVPVVVRIPPSPTGFLHIGTARTALFNYLFAKQTGGKIYLRIEDTDKERSKKEFENNIIDALGWLGITYENTEPIRQSERTELYKKRLKELLDAGHVYISKEEGGEGKRTEVIRFKNPNKKISFEDMVRGTVEFDTTDLKDFVVAKSLDEPLYHLAVVVDDIDMGVTHVIRGEDHISNTPRQILIIEALGAARPIYAHIPLILAADRSKLSKRHGAVAVTEYREKGFLSDALVNYLALLGWNPGDEKEIFSRDELIAAFDLSKVQKGGAIFDEVKLRSINREYLRQSPDAISKIVGLLSAKESVRGALGESPLKKIAELVLERIDTLKDAEALIAAGEFDYFFEAPSYAAENLLWKKEPDRAKTVATVGDAITALEAIAESDFDAENIKTTLLALAEKVGKGPLLWPMRFALSGKEKSTDPFTIAGVIGKNETLARLKSAITLLSN